MVGGVNVKAGGVILRAPIEMVELNELNCGSGHAERKTYDPVGRTVSDLDSGFSSNHMRAYASAHNDLSGHGPIS